ncbi:hypothetical protein [Paracidovorax cattleyae]|uniref:Uncharacterized protein n=1 Tax=Paracidovorax cattleyae TaxID=80868 RepID=A0A1H0U4G0_9BURK|nr:hypothetical protein [Paracidovorax cattleyae]SDP60726.1 hypothetical protein SAMN04489708_117107 [Paracidovorax cattleyae]
MLLTANISFDFASPGKLSTYLAAHPPCVIASVLGEAMEAVHAKR